MVVIKRYPNRKLYNTEAKEYITLEGIARLIRQGEEIQVMDHTTGEDLTALTFTQYILEQEKKQSGLLSNSFLTGLIRAGGDRLTALQRSLFSTTSLWCQIDEEIKQRIQALVSRGELTNKEGESLIGKMIEEGKRQSEERATRNLSLINQEQLEKYLVQLQIPTRTDLQHLHHQIEELSSKLEEFMEGSQH